MEMNEGRASRGSYTDETTCRIEGCEAPVQARWLCTRHYKRWERHGRPEAFFGPADPQTYTPDGTVSGRTCARCKTWKSALDFPADIRRPDRLHAYCLDCRRADAKERRQRDPEGERRRQRRTNLKRLYGISEHDYDEMLREQDGKCASCRSADPRHNSGRFVVDHDHRTGEIRGLLCGPCNIILGLAQDDVAVLAAAITYLTKGK